MAKIERSALMPYPARVMYDIVNDVRHYPEFLPWCGDSRIEYGRLGFNAGCRPESLV